ncbi:DUF397 domain-containing protein [Lentzea sp. NPDC058450]|uniref:DUF397 domain-containing protein n=1 Tax=Lentzea sp. NPDC058450 TaxID=3346505 RepID=UPI00364DB666
MLFGVRCEGDGVKRASRACVVQVDGDGGTWIKSSASGPKTGSQSCVEFSTRANGAVLVRSSRDREGGRLRFGEPSWALFLADVKSH